MPRLLPVPLGMLLLLQPRSLGKHSNSWQSMVTNPEQSTDYRIIPVHTYIPPPTYIPIRTPLLSLRPWLISGGFCFRLFFFFGLSLIENYTLCFQLKLSEIYAQSAINLSRSPAAIAADYRNLFS